MCLITLLKTEGWLFCRMFLNLSLAGVSSQLYLYHAFWGKNTTQVILCLFQGIMSGGTWGCFVPVLGA